MPSDVAEVLERSMWRAVNAARIMATKFGLTEDEWRAAVDWAMWRVKERWENGEDG